MRSQILKSALALIVCMTTGLSATVSSASGDPEAGKKVFNRCKACHKIGEGAKNSSGPALTNVHGNPAGMSEGYNYSKSLKAAGEGGLVWTDEMLARWLMDPKAFLKEVLDDDSAKTKMSLKLKKAEDAANVIAYLASFSSAAASGSPGEIAANTDSHSGDTPFRGPGMRIEENNSLPLPGDDDYVISESGTTEDLEFMQKVIAKMKELRLWDGPDAIQVPVYPGLRPHGVILGTLITNAEIDGRVGELIVKRSFEHLEAETNANKAVREVQANPDKYLSNYAIMYRRENGYQDAHNNWFYAEFDPEGEVIVYEGEVLAGRAGLCVSCHVLAEGEDYFFTTNGIE